MNECQALAGFRIGHPAVEHGDALLQRGQLVLGIFFESFAPPFLQIVGADIAHELEDQFAGRIRSQQGVRVARGLGDIQRGDINVDLERRRLPQAETVERQIAAFDLGLVWEVDALAFFGLCDVGAQCGND